MRDGAVLVAFVLAGNVASSPDGTVVEAREAKPDAGLDAVTDVTEGPRRRAELRCEPVQSE
jgi:hypothetical protein